MFEGGFSEEGSLMEDILPGGEEWLDGPVTGISSIPPQLMWADQRIDVVEGPETGKAGADAGGEGGMSDAIILDTMEDYTGSPELDPPRFPGGLPMDDVSATPQISTTPIPPGTSTPPLTPQPRKSLRNLENDDLYWKRFDILPSVPTDHAFYDRPVARPSRTFMGRLQKEYRALSTGLPGTLILVCVTGSHTGFLISFDPRSGI